MPSVGDKNLYPNPSAETGTHGWNAAGFTLTASTEAASVGTQSLRCASTGTAPDLYTPLTYADARSLKVDPSTQYTVSAHIYAAKAISAQFRVTNRTSADVSGSALSSDVLSIPAAAWTRISFTFTTDATAAMVYVEHLITGVVSGDVFYVDAAMLHLGGTLLDYGDGDQAGWQWTGTVHDSISEYVGVPSGNGRGPIWITGQPQQATADPSGKVVGL